MSKMETKHTPAPWEVTQSKTAKRYRLAVSRTFPSTHKRKGEETDFELQIKNALGITCKYCREVERFDGDCCGFIPGNRGEKIHTIRANYPLWAKRMEEVQAGRAVIELFYWEDKPYRSKQIVFATLDKDSGCGMQCLGFYYNDISSPILYLNVRTERSMSVESIAKNDGLPLEDFKEWFRRYDISKAMAIIHFTKFRY